MHRTDSAVTVAVSALSPGSAIRIAGVFAIARLMACWVPYHFAIGGLPDNMSLAVAAGFDQNTAVLGIAGALGLASLWAATRPAPRIAVPTSAKGIGFSLDTGFASMVVALLLIAVLLYLNGDDRYNELSYFTDRKNLMALGRIPYRDFLFNYGPVLIWTPYLLHVVLPGDWMRAYVLADAGFLLLSLVLIRQLVRSLPVPDRTRGMLAYVVKWPFPVPFKAPENASLIVEFIDTAARNCLPVERVGAIVVCHNREYP